MRNAILLLCFLLLLSGCICDQRKDTSIIGIREFNVSSGMKNIAWSRAHGFAVRNGLYSFGTVNDFIISFVYVHRDQNGFYESYQTIIAREWHEKGFRYKINVYDRIFLVNDKENMMKFEQRKMDVQQKTLDDVAEKIMQYIINGV